MRTATTTTRRDSDEKENHSLQVVKGQRLGMLKVIVWLAAVARRSSSKSADSSSSSSSSSSWSGQGQSRSKVGWGKLPVPKWQNTE